LVIKSLTLLSSPDLEVKYIGGIDPRMLFLENGEETEVSGRLTAFNPNTILDIIGRV
jgi:hypothetical protein